MISNASCITHRHPHACVEEEEFPAICIKKMYKISDLKHIHFITVFQHSITVKCIKIEMMKYDTVALSLSVFYELPSTHCVHNLIEGGVFYK
jgi:hypothetical protein